MVAQLALECGINLDSMAPAVGHELPQRKSLSFSQVIVYGLLNKRLNIFLIKKLQIALGQ
jgi:hypothetical protein